LSRRGGAGALYRSRSSEAAWRRVELCRKCDKTRAGRVGASADENGPTVASGDKGVAAAVARVLELYPEVRDWPPEELRKLAPTILEQHDAKMRTDKS